MTHNDKKAKESEGILLNLRRYFDEVAWKKQEGGTWTDTELEVSPTRLNDLYSYREHARNRHRLKREGRYFLDAGCGARPYTVYATGFKHHVCVDFSMTGLRGARKNFDGKAYFVQADIRRLPFKSGTFDGLCCPYVIYHIPEMENQREAFKELHRNLNAGCSGVVIYDNPNHLGIRLRKLARRWPMLKSFAACTVLKKKIHGGATKPSEINKALKAREELLHYEPLPATTIEQFVDEKNAISVRTHSLLSEPAKKAWLRDTILWNVLLRMLLLCESSAGLLLRPLAAVWCVVIRKGGCSPR